MDRHTHDDRTVDVRSEERGAHWVAWIEGPDGKPRDAAVVIGESREVAERGARQRASGGARPEA